MAERQHSAQGVPPPLGNLPPGQGRFRSEMTHSFRCFAVFCCALPLICCDDAPPGRSSTATSSAPTPVLNAASSAPSAAPAEPKAPKHALSNAQFAKLFEEASETSQYFFSDNHVSNETSYLQVAPALDKRSKHGGAYLGVGPEQNFSYLALLKPELAFIVDIRRANALQHLWYKALFEDAKDRFQFLAALTGRASRDTVAESEKLEGILEKVAGLPKSERGFRQSVSTVRTRISSWGVKLSAADRKSLQAAQRAFFDQGLTLAFELHEDNGRTYPTLQALLLQKDPSGRLGGFLASHESFALVKKMQKENRIVPVVGDFAGDHALPRIAEELKRRSLPVNAFYVSNVEQYLLKPETWPKWVRNIGSLPSNETSVFIRCYLDQGKRHPAQLGGHRTATVLSSFDHFKWRSKKKPYRSFYEISTDGALEN